jgi:hypothetical protein
MFPFLCWYELYWNVIIFLINWSLAFIEHLLIPGPWFDLKLWTTKRVHHFQNCAPTNTVWKLVTEFLGLYITAQLSARWLSLFFSCGHQGAGLWATQSLILGNNDVFLLEKSPCFCFDALTFRCRILWALTWLFSDMYQGLCVIWIIWWKDNAFLKKSIELVTCRTQMF